MAIGPSQPEAQRERRWRLAGGVLAGLPVGFGAFMVGTYIALSSPEAAVLAGVIVVIALGALIAKESTRVLAAGLLMGAALGGIVGAGVCVALLLALDKAFSG